MEGSELSGLSELSVLWSLRTLKIAQGALRAAQSCSESLRAAQSRPERSLRGPELLRLKSRSELHGV